MSQLGGMVEENEEERGQQTAVDQLSEQAAVPDNAGEIKEEKVLNNVNSYISDSDGGDSVSKTQSNERMSDDDDDEDEIDERKVRGFVDISVALFTISVLIFIAVALVIFFTGGKSKSQVNNPTSVDTNGLNFTFKNDIRMRQVNRAIKENSLTKDSAAHQVLKYRFGEAFNNHGNGRDGELTQKDFDEYNTTNERLSQMDGHFDWWMFPYSQTSSRPELALQTYQDWLELINLEFEYPIDDIVVKESFIDLMIHGVNVLIRAKRDVNHDIVCNAHPRRKEKMLCSLWDFSRVLSAEKKHSQRIKVIRSIGELMDQFECMPKWRDSKRGTPTSSNRNAGSKRRRLFETEEQLKKVARKTRNSCLTEQTNMNLLFAEREIDPAKVPSGLKKANSPEW